MNFGLLREKNLQIDSIISGHDFARGLKSIDDDLRICHEGHGRYTIDLKAILPTYYYRPVAEVAATNPSGESWRYNIRLRPSHLSIVLHYLMILFFGFQAAFLLSQDLTEHLTVIITFGAGLLIAHGISWALNAFHYSELEASLRRLLQARE